MVKIIGRSSGGEGRSSYFGKNVSCCFQVMTASNLRRASKKVLDESHPNIISPKPESALKYDPPSLTSYPTAC